MGANILLIIAASLLVIGSAAGHGTTASQVFHVTGKVLCQDCGEGWNEWINDAKPINGSKVSVTCLDDRHRVIQYASDFTDVAGDFEITWKKYVNGKKLKPQNCFLRLVSSPDPVCSIATNFAGGKTGLRLRRPNMVYRDVVKYMLGKFYYTTPMCDEPDTSGPDADDDSDDAKKSKYGNDDSHDAEKSNDDSDDDAKKSHYGSNSEKRNYDSGDAKNSNY